MITLIGYKKCSTCANIEKLLKEKQIEYVYRHIDKENPTSSEIRTWHQKTKLDIKKFFNTSGVLYRKKELAKKLPNYTLEEKYDLLATDGKLVKRPILITENSIYVGKQVKEYLQSL